MSTFALIEPYLDSEDITEILLESGHAPSVKMAGEYVPITRGVPSTVEIESLVAGTPISALLAAASAESAPVRIVLAGKPRMVVARRRGSAVQVRIGPPPREAPGPGPSRAARRGPAAPSAEAATLVDDAPRRPPRAYLRAGDARAAQARAPKAATGSSRDSTRRRHRPSWRARG